MQFIVSDPLGRRMGNDGTRAKESPLREIPGSGYGIESTGDDESGSPGPESIQSGIRPAAGTYTVTLYGIVTTQFDLYISGQDVFGDRQPNSQSLDGFIAVGTTAQYVLSFNPAPGTGISQFVKQVSFATLRQDLRTAAGLGLIGDAKFVAKLDKTLAQGEKALVRKAHDHDKLDEGRENKKKAVEKLREFIKKLEKAFKGENDDDRDEDDDKDHDKKHEEKEHEKPAKRSVSELAFKSLKGDAEVLIGTLGGKPGKGGEE